MCVQAAPEAADPAASSSSAFAILSRQRAQEESDAQASAACAPTRPQTVRRVGLRVFMMLHISEIQRGELDESVPHRLETLVHRLARIGEGCEEMCANCVISRCLVCMHGIRRGSQPWPRAHTMRACSLLGPNELRSLLEVVRSGVD